MTTTNNFASTAGPSQRTTINIELDTYLQQERSYLNYVLLDCDGILANWVQNVINFAKGRTKLQHKDWNTWNKHLEIYSEAEMQQLQESRLFWDTIPVYPFAHSLYSFLLERRNVYICTAPWIDAPECAASKYAWLKHHFNIQSSDVVIAKRKNLLAKPEALLIDDNPKNCQLFFAAGGNALLYPRPWNNAQYTESELQMKIIELLP